MGAESGISKAEVSRICAELDTDVTYCKARVGGDRYGKGAPVVRFRHRGQGCNRPHPACSATSPPDGRAAAKGWFASSADYLSPLTLPTSRITGQPGRPPEPSAGASHVVGGLRSAEVCGLLLKTTTRHRHGTVIDILVYLLDNRSQARFDQEYGQTIQGDE